MGYYTDYTLTTIPEQLPADFDSKFKEITSYSVADIDGNIKWYDHDEDMLKLSALYPNIFFTLEGVGEDSDDRWISYYVNGKSQDGNLHKVYDEPDFSLLDNFDTRYPEYFI